MDYFLSVQFKGGKLMEINPRVSTIVYTPEINPPALAVGLALGHDRRRGAAPAAPAGADRTARDPLLRPGRVRLSHAAGRGGGRPDRIAALVPASPPRDPTAVVADVGWVNGLAAIRSLGRHGVRALAVDHRPWALGFRSRYATPVVAPDPGVDEDGFVAALARLGRDARRRPCPRSPPTTST